MAQCKDFDPTQVESIVAYPMDYMLEDKLEALAYEHRSSLNAGDIDLRVLDGRKSDVPMSDTPTFSDNVDVSRPGKAYNIEIEIPCRNPTERELGFMDGLESEPFVLLIKCFLSVYFIVIPSKDTWVAVHNLKDGVHNIKISCQNASGIIPYFYDVFYTED